MIITPCWNVLVKTADGNIEFHLVAESESMVLEKAASLVNFLTEIIEMEAKRCSNH